MRISDWSSDVCSSDLLVVLDHVGRRRVLVERAGLVLLDPDADQVARDVVTLRQTVQRLAGENLLRDLPLELDAMGTVSCHGLPSPKARPTRSHPQSLPVPPQRRPPPRGEPLTGGLPEPLRTFSGTPDSGG